MKLIESLKNYLRIYMGVSSKFSKHRLLPNKVREMILRFINSIQDNVLSTYHITFDFQTAEKAPSHYRLELLAELRNDLECNFLIAQLQQQIGSKFHRVKFYDKQITTIHDRKQIENDFKNTLKNHVSMKFIFRQNINDGFGKILKVTDNSIPINGVKDYRVNILKSGQIPFSIIEDMFCIEILTEDFK